MRNQWYKKGNELLKEIENTTLSEDEVSIWYIGQCGFVIKKEAVIYIDPVLGDLQNDEGISKRLYPPPYSPEEAYADYVICTHRHADHMHRETIRGIYASNPNVRFIVPGICKKNLVAWGIAQANIIEARQHQEIDLGSINIVPISTAHPNHKTEEDGTEWNLAYDIAFEKIHILHLGDTYLTKQLLEDLKELEAPDLFMVPINGSDYMRDSLNIVGNMSAKEAAYLAIKLGADISIPMHYDLVKGNTESPLNFIRGLWENDADKKFRLPVLGERIICRREI